MVVGAAVGLFRGTPEHSSFKDIGKLSWEISRSWYGGLERLPSLIAAESSHMRAVKKYFASKTRFDKEQLYLSGYWKA